MRQLLCVLLILTCGISIGAKDYTEAFNSLSTGNGEIFMDVEKVRVINGGTVIIPTFDSSCPEYIKAPFAYACKIMEEYLPPCLPLEVTISCGNFSGMSKDRVSRVRTWSKENFGAAHPARCVPMSTIKGVILGELGYGFGVTYLDSISNLDFLLEYPDIDICYNKEILEEMSFSLDPNPGYKYDFVSIVLRDLLIGLGLSSGFMHNPLTNDIQITGDEYTPFEYYINEILGRDSNPNDRFNKATSGELLLGDTNNAGLKRLKLYAPQVWDNVKSLNYFIPQEGCCVSNVLSYDFGKGSVCRSLNDNYSNHIFRDLLQWIYNFLVGTGNSSAGYGGSTDNFIAFDGYSRSNSAIAPDRLGVNYGNNDRSNIYVAFDGSEEKKELLDYVYQFHPGHITFESGDTEMSYMSILKKDGTWEIVKAGMGWAEFDNLTTRDLRFHSDPSEYARTIDGYLRARITVADRDRFGAVGYSSKFYVVDFLPQTVKLGYSFLSNTSVLNGSQQNECIESGEQYSTYQADDAEFNTSSSSRVARLFFTQTEGVKSIIIDAFSDGSSVPNRIFVDSDEIKKGYRDVEIANKTKFIVNAINDNGSSVSEPLIVNPQLAVNPWITISVTQDVIYINSDDVKLNKFLYTICTPTSTVVNSGKTDYSIDISALPKGIYVLNLWETSLGITKSFTFVK